MDAVTIESVDLRKVYRGTKPVEALRGISLSVGKGEAGALKTPSPYFGISTERNPTICMGFGRYLHSVETTKPMGYLKPKTKTKKEGFGIGFRINCSQ